MLVNLREGWYGFGPKQTARLTPKVSNIIPGSPIAFEGMPTDGLLAGTVCLSPTLAGSLGDADVAHVVGNMEDEGLKIERGWILYSSSSQGQLFSGCPSRRL